jgi:hypothetical protein
MIVSRKKRDTTPVAEAAELAHGLLGENDANQARINIRYKTLAKMAPRKWGDEGHGLGEPAPALEPTRNDDARNALDQHPLKEQIMAWQRIADAAKAKKKT